MDPVPPVAAPPPAAAPQTVVIKTADVVAAGAPAPVRPDAPTPAPASLAQKGEVAKSSMSAEQTEMGRDAVQSTERLLKPFGMPMLPRDPDMPPPGMNATTSDSDEVAQTV